MRLIDADALKTELVHDYAYAAAIMVDKQPTIDPARHGRWEHSRMQSEFSVVKCSVCGTEMFSISRTVTDGNYCPSCGAKMDGQGGVK